MSVCRRLLRRIEAIKTLCGVGSAREKLGLSGMPVWTARPLYVVTEYRRDDSDAMRHEAKTQR